MLHLLGPSCFSGLPGISEQLAISPNLGRGAIKKSLDDSRETHRSLSTTEGFRHPERERLFTIEGEAEVSLSMKATKERKR